MYLTAGLFKGRKIIVPQGVKPTLSKVRESVFNMLLSFEFSENSFLDMFSGSGLMGLEAISRGFSVVALEKNPKNAAIIKSNYKNSGLTPDLIIADCLKFKTDKKFDVVYLDPPWGSDYSIILKKATELKSDCGVIVVEYDKQRDLDLSKIIFEEKLDLEILKNKKYGRTLITFLA